MHKFYVIFKNQDSIEGTTTMPSDEFSRKIIQPNVDDIYTFQFWDEEENETSDFDVVDYINTPEEENDWWPDSDENMQEEPINYNHIVVSTSFAYNEIMVFPADENGNITDWGDLACIRGTTSTDHISAMHGFDMHNDYELVKVVKSNNYLHQTLWKKK